jgi:hypothetical protein
MDEGARLHPKAQRPKGPDQGVLGAWAGSAVGDPGWRWRRRPPLPSPSLPQPSLFPVLARRAANNLFRGIQPATGSAILFSLSITQGPRPIASATLLRSNHRRVLCHGRCSAPVICSCFAVDGAGRFVAAIG